LRLQDDDDERWKIFGGELGELIADEIELGSSQSNTIRLIKDIRLKFRRESLDLTKIRQLMRYVFLYLAEKRPEVVDHPDLRILTTHANYSYYETPIFGQFDNKYNKTLDMYCSGLYLTLLLKAESL